MITQRKVFLELVVVYALFWEIGLLPGEFIAEGIFLGFAAYTLKTAPKRIWHQPLFGKSKDSASHG